MSANDLIRFDIVNGAITAVYEFDDGRWQYEPIEWDERYSLQGTDIVKQEYDDGYLETTLYSPQGDGTYREVSETGQSYSRPSSDDDAYLPPVTDSTLTDSLLANEDLMRFEITDGIVTRAFEFDDGRWELETIDRDETYTVNGTDVIKQEYDDGYIETSLYRDIGEGIFQVVEQSHDRPDLNSISPVSQDAEVVRLYLSILDREPDVEGYHYWDSQMDEGMSLNQLAQYFIESDEFKRDYADADNTQFVTRLYENVLSRQPDEEGLAWWCEHLDSGEFDHDDLVVGFVQSEEFIASSEDTVQAFLHNTWASAAQADILIS